jgi:hypothetical protein
MKVSRHDGIGRSLVELYARHRAELGKYPWEWEEYRWQELVGCILSDGLGVAPAVCRDAVRVLSRLKMLSPSALANADDEEKDQLRHS